MNENDREQALKNYVLVFDEKTNNGRVFTFDISSLDIREGFLSELTEDEKQERKDWAKTRSDLQSLYPASGMWTDLTRKEMLLLRVAPPLLNDCKVTARTRPDEGLKRLYLDKIYAWEDFATGVGSFVEPAGEGKSITADDVLFFSLNPGVILDSEDAERNFVIYQVLDKLQKVGLLEHGTRADALDLLECDTQSRKPPPPIPANADHFLLAGDNKTVPIEFKATHNLLVPEKAVDVIRRYNAAVDEVKETQERTIDRTNMGHQLAQIIHYMFVGGSRHGVLSSGSRSYFFKVEDTADGPRVFITDAWFIGQKDYLRAVSYLYDLAKHNGDFQPPVGWENKWLTWTLASTPDRDQPVGRMATEGRDGAGDSTGERQSKSRKRGKRGAAGQFMTWLDPSLAPSIPRVDGRDTKLVRLLGAGNSLVYLSHWNGAEVAVKVFDFYKDLAWFEKEIRAYDYLKDAWGVLVPKPYFIADKFGLVLLGMELGRIPNSSDTKFRNERDILFRKLRRDYGFDHLDQEPRNVIYLSNKNRRGKARLVAIDLELHEILR